MATTAEAGKQSSGWVIILAAFLLYFIHAGAGMYAFSLFLTPLTGSLGWSIAAVAGGISAYQLFGGVISPVAGRVTDMFGPVRVLLVGALLGGASFIMLGFTDLMGAHLWYFYLFFVLVAVGNSLGGMISISTALAQRYVKARGLAIGMANLGVSAGGVAMVPVVQALLSNLGWERTFISLGVLTIAVGAPVAIFMARYLPRSTATPRAAKALANPTSTATRPLVVVAEVTPALGRMATKGLQERRAAMSAAGVVYPLQEIVKSPAFWSLHLAVFFSTFGEMGTLLHQTKILTDAGVSNTLAAASLTFIAGLAAFGRLGFGWFGDRVSARWSFIASFGVASAGIALITQVHISWVLLPFVLVWGVSMGACSTLRPLLVGDFFGLSSFGLLVGTLNLMHQLGAAAGTYFAAYIFTNQGSYTPALLTFIGTYVLATAILLLPSYPRVAAVPHPSRRALV